MLLLVVNLSLVVTSSPRRTGCRSPQRSWALPGTTGRPLGPLASTAPAASATCPRHALSRSRGR